MSYRTKLLLSLGVAGAGWVVLGAVAVAWKLYYEPWIKGPWTNGGVR